MAKFKKGQKVYRASGNISMIYKTGEDDIALCMVVERTIDSCGEKRMTFVDYGSDFTFGRSVDMKYAENYFSTPEEAFEYLKSYSGYRTCYEIHPEVVSDRDDKWYHLAQEWKESHSVKEKFPRR